MSTKTKFDPTLISVIADVFINFSVFWFGIAIISPLFPGIDPSLKLLVLTMDMLAGTILIYLGYRLRRMIL